MLGDYLVLRYSTPLPLDLYKIDANPIDYSYDTNATGDEVVEVRVVPFILC